MNNDVDFEAYDFSPEHGPKFFRIPTDNLGRFQVAIKRLTKLAAKLGVPAPTVGEFGTETKVVWRDKRKVEVVLHRIGVCASEIKIPGWTLLAHLEHLEGGNIVTVIAEGVEGAAFNALVSTCAHCQVERTRKATYVIREDATQKVVQVGTSCVVDFTGHKNAETVAMYNEFLRDLETAEDEGEESFGRAREVYSPLEILAMTARVLQLAPFVSRRTAQDGQSTTRDLVEALLQDPASDSKSTAAFRRDLEEKVNEERATFDAARTATWILGFADKVQISDYESNLLVLMRQSYLKPKFIGYLASAQASMDRAERVALERRRAFEPGHFGEAGQKFSIRARYMGTVSFDSQYGTTHIHRFRTEDGKCLVWKTGSTGLQPSVHWLDKAGNGRSVEIKKGAMVYLAATVKGHDRYRDQDQTLITRADVLTRPNHLAVLAKLNKPKRPRKQKALTSTAM